MGRIIDGLWKVMVKFDHPNGGRGYDVTDHPSSYDDAARFVMLLGLGYPYEVVVDGKAHNVRVTSSMLLGPFNE